MGSVRKYLALDAKTLKLSIVLPFTENITITEAIDKVLQGDKITLEYPPVTDSRINFISGFLFRFLGRLDMVFLTEILLVLIKEIVSNSAKANAKRIFFKSKNLDINDQEDYVQGLALYSNAAIKNWDEFIKTLPDSDLYIQISIQKENDEYVFSINNNVEILPQEWKRINDRLDSFKSDKNLETAFKKIRDPSEGAGLGIVMAQLLLQNSGLPFDKYRIESENGVTKTSFRVPLNINPPPVKSQVKDKIVKVIDNLPAFPDNINQIIALCDSQSASLQQIGEKIQQDPGLTAEIVKMANSAGYMNRFQNPSVIDCVKIIGVKAIHDLLMVTGARDVMGKKFPVRQMEDIWESSNRISFFARKLVREKAALREGAALGGLLCEIGKIVLLSLKPELVEQINNLTGAGRFRNTATIEESAMGISHPEIGKLLTTKWKFPESLITSISNQHKPLEAPEKYSELCNVVYLATRVQESSINRGDYYSVESEVLEAFNVLTPMHYEEMVRRLAEEYDAANAENK